MKRKSLLTLIILTSLLTFLCSDCNPPPPEPPEPPKKPIPASVTDIDGNKYHVKRFGNTLWMTENLRVTRYDTESRNSGKTIVEATKDQPATKNEPYFVNAKDFEESPCTDNFTDEIRNELGFLYNWCAATGMSNNSASVRDTAQGICPNGWRLPLVSDLNNLYEHLGGEEIAGLKLKAVYGWYPNSGCGDNESGMSCYPAGLAVSEAPITAIAFVGAQTMFWCSRSVASISTKSAVLRLISDKDAAETLNIEKFQANSVRCVLDIDDSFEQ